MGGFLVWSFIILWIIFAVAWCVFPFAFTIHVLRKQSKDEKEHPEWYKDCKSSDDGVFMSSGDNS